MPIKYRWLAFIIGLLLVCLAGIGYFGLKTWQSINVIPRSPTSLPNITPTPTPDPNRPFSILMLGYGGYFGNTNQMHDGGLLTDSMMLVSIYPKKQLINLISIPRDLWVPLPIGTGTTLMSKINAAYADGSDDKTYPHKPVQYTGPAGGGQMAKDVVSQIIGQPVDYFVAIDFSGFQKIIDDLGNITVPVAKTLDDPFYPIEEKTKDTCGKSDAEVAALTATMSGDKLEQQFTCRYEHLHFDPGLQQMDGITALKYARSRHGLLDGGDFNRAARQRIVVEAVKKKIMTIGFIPKIIPTIQTLSKHIQTDIDLTTMEKLITKANLYNQYTISQTALTDTNVLKDSISIDGQFILIPRIGIGNWQEIQQYITTPDSVISPTPTITPRPTKKPL